MFFLVNVISYWLCSDTEIIQINQITSYELWVDSGRWMRF